MRVRCCTNAADAARAASQSSESACARTRWSRRSRAAPCAGRAWMRRVADRALRHQLARRAGHAAGPPPPHVTTPSQPSAAPRRTRAAAAQVMRACASAGAVHGCTCMRRQRRVQARTSAWRALASACALRLSCSAAACSRCSRATWSFASHRHACSMVSCVCGARTQHSVLGKSAGAAEACSLRAGGRCSTRAP